MRKLIVLLVVLLTPSLASARLEAGLGLSLGWPMGDFKDEVDFAGGGGARVGWGTGDNSPVKCTLFFDVNYLNYGRESRTEPFSYTVPDVRVRVVTENFLMHFNPGVSFGRSRGVVRPYAEISGGLTYIATKTKIENDNLFSESFVESTNFDDFAFNIGGAAGLKFRVWQSSSDIDKVELREALIDIKVGYIKGGEAEYLKKGSIERLENGTVRYETIQSDTDIVQARIGVYLTF